MIRLAVFVLMCPKPSRKKFGPVAKTDVMFVSNLAVKCARMMGYSWSNRHGEQAGGEIIGYS